MQVEIFNKLANLLRDISSDLDLVSKIPGSKAKEDKKQLHLYGKKEVSIAGRKPQPTYLAGIFQQKGYVGLYFMPIYSHPDKFKDANDDLKSLLKGKSCFHIKDITPARVKQLESLLNKGKRIYSDLGWI